MMVLGKKAVFCLLVIFALGMCAMIERTRMRDERRRAMLRRVRGSHPRHHTVKKVLSGAMRDDNAVGKGYTKARSKWNTVRRRRHHRQRSGKHTADEIGWHLGNEDKASWWNGANVCIRNETHESVERTEESDDGRDVDEGHSKADDGNGTFSMTESKRLLSSSCEATETTYKCTSVQGQNGRLVTSVKVFECCPGYDRKSDTPGCTKAYDVTDLMSTFERLDLTQMALKLKKSNFVNINGQNYTIFAPTNDAFDKAKIENKDVSTMGHVVKSVHHTVDMEDDQLLDSEDPLTAIRINKYNRGASIMVTANCVPLVAKDMLATNGIVHTVKDLLPTVKKSLDEIVVDDPQLTQLSKVIKRMELKDRGHYTLFAPTDSAFLQMKSNLKDKIFNGEQCGLELLRQHLLPSVLCSAVVESEALTRNVLHHLINLVRERDNLTANGAALIGTDIMATNGVMHIVSRILIPKNAGDIFDILDRRGTKKFLRMIKKNAGLTKRLQNLNNFTIFVPTNDALEALPDSNDFEKLFNYHVVPQRMSYHDLRDNMELKTLDENNDIRVNSYHKFPFIAIKTAQCASIVQSHADSCEDIVHVVSKVMQPPNGDVLNVLKADRNFSSLVALVDSLKLNKLFTMRNLLTFFAPTNKAFDSLSPAAAKLLREDARVLTRVIKSHMLDGVVCCSGIVDDTFPFSGPKWNLDDGDVSLTRDDRVSFKGVPVISCDQTATNGVVHGIDQFVPEALSKYGIDRRDKLRRRLGLLLGSDNVRHH